MTVTHRVLTLVLLSITAGCGRSAVRVTGATGQVVDVSALRCEGDSRLDAIQYSAAEGRAAERAAIARTDGTVRRDSLTLLIRLRSGRVLDLRDCLVAGDHTRIHEFMGRGPRARGLLVGLDFYEGGGVLWIDDSTGAQTFLQAAPVFSPDSVHFVVANVDLEAQYSENVFSIWRVTGARIIPRLILEGGDDWGAEDPVWLGPNAVRYTKVSGSPDAYRRAPVVARQRRGRWRVEAPKR